MLNIILIGIALGFDAFGVALGLGCGNKLVRKQKLGLIFSFGFFQFLLTVGGAFLGNFINNNLFQISNLLSGIIIVFIGLLLLKDGYEKDEVCTYVNFTFFSYVVLGVSVSIDALGVGFSILYNLKNLILFEKSVVIGLVSILMTTVAFGIVPYIKKLDIMEKYADYIGGVILLIFGFNMIF